ncbi:hypothetical protein WKK05_38970 (plasmid) [Nostoc sp. UHCC 0302]|uniref:hypothetical protein n=1 Tax=Nostoc sp. UHCC 0302 TaxID=3134896 RepID=UPI00311CDBDD
MIITSDIALAIGVNFLFAVHRPCIREEIRLYLELAQEDLCFLNFWDLDNGILKLTFYDGTEMYFDALSSCTFNFLKEQVEFFADAIQFPRTITN